MGETLTPAGRMLGAGAPKKDGVQQREEPMENASRKDGAPQAKAGVRASARSGDDWLKISLQKVYEPKLAEPIPENWLALLGRIDTKDSGDG